MFSFISYDKQYIVWIGNFVDEAKKTKKNGSWCILEMDLTNVAANQMWNNTKR